MSDLNKLINKNMSDLNNNLLNTIEEMREENSERYIGIVKWFSNKLGYGFITYADKLKVFHDVFVHHTSVKPQKTTYRTLTLGEYVEFSLTVLKNNDKKQAINVTGPFYGQLLSDSLDDFRNNRSHQGYNDLSDLNDLNQKRIRDAMNNNENNGTTNANKQNKQNISNTIALNIARNSTSLVANNSSSMGWNVLVRKSREQKEKPKK